MKYKIAAGDKVGRLTRRELVETNRARGRVYRWSCDCGGEVLRPLAEVANRATPCCGRSCKYFFKYGRYINAQDSQGDEATISSIWLRRPIVGQPYSQELQRVSKNQIMLNLEALA